MIPQRAADVVEDARLKLIDVLRVSSTVASTNSRLAKTAAIAQILKLAAPAEIPLVVSYLSGRLPQRRPGIGWASMRSTPSPAMAPNLKLLDVDSCFSEIESLSGTGSAARRMRMLDELMSRATREEQKFLTRLVGGELRQGALSGVMTAAIAQASEIDIDLVRQAAMVTGSLSEAAVAALGEGAAPLAGLTIEVGRPVQPMLAQSAANITAALAKVCPATVEYKLDGVRIQAHKSGDRVRVFTRTLDEITDRVPEITEVVASLQVESIIMDGEVICLREDGKPLPFQVTGSRVASKGSIEKLRTELPLTAYFFDLLYLNGHSVAHTPAATRYESARKVSPMIPWAPRITAWDAQEAAEFLGAAIRAGHEGVVVKDPNSLYEAGRRGGGWIKVKPHHTLDLVVLAAEWGHGRRTGKLSNLHLGAKEDEGDSFVMLGKTFKGLTDKMLIWQTEALLGLEVRRTTSTIFVRPELVVEVAFDGLQASTRYPGGLALRFARVIRYRDDKMANDADSMETVRSLYRG